MKSDFSMIFVCLSIKNHQEAYISDREPPGDTLRWRKLRFFMIMWRKIAKSENSEISARNCLSGLHFHEISINFLRCAQCFSYRLRRLAPAGVSYVCACVQRMVCNSCWAGRSRQFRILTWLVETAFHKSSCALEQYCFSLGGKSRPVRVGNS